MNPRRILEGLQPLLPRSLRGAVVLAYHLVGAGTDSPVDLPLSTFRRQMLLLQERCTVLPLGDVLARHEATSRPRVVLTFDDAYENFRRFAWPVLVELGLPAILYVPTEFVEGRLPPPIRGTSLAPCTWDDLRALVREGVAVGSHSVTHRNLTELAPDEVDRELADSRAALEDRLGCEVTSFCYPRAKWNRAVARRVAVHYETAVTAGGRRVNPNRVDRSRIPRFPVRRDLGSLARLVESRVGLSEAVSDGVRRWLR